MHIVMRLTDHQLARWRNRNGENIPVPPKPRKHRRQEESRIQSNLISWWAVKHREFGIPELMLFSIPNGGFRTKETAAILKREGARSGVSDLFLSVPRGKYHGCFLELKTETGTPSDSQKAFIAAVQAQGYAASVAYGFDDAVRFLEAYIRGEEFF